MFDPVGEVMSQITAAWIERFATRLIELQPGVLPLDAVRNATCAYRDASRSAPEVAAAVYVAAAGQVLPRARTPAIKRAPATRRRCRARIGRVQPLRGRRPTVS